MTPFKARILTPFGGRILTLGLSAMFVFGCSKTGVQQNTDSTSVAMQDTSKTTDPMANVDPQQKAVLDQLGSMGGKPIASLSAEEARKQPSPADAVKALLEKKGMSTAPEAVGKVENRMIAGGGGQIPVRIYWPKGNGPFPVLVYFHGGGWVIATNDTYDASARALVNQASYIVVSPEYRKAPENKFPAAHMDAIATYKWVLANAQSIHGDPKKIAVGGESAGGNLATEVAIMARDQKLQMPIHQLLVYPVTNTDMNDKSYMENADAKPLNKAMMAWFVDKTIKDQSDLNNPMLVPMKVASLAGLPSATVITAQLDPLRTEGEAYANKLKAAGVKVEYRNFDGVAHEFFGQAAVLDKAKEAEAFAASNLRKAAGMVQAASMQ